MSDSVQRPHFFEQAIPFQSGSAGFLQQIENLLDPAVVAITTCGVSFYTHGHISALIFLLSLLLFALVFPGRNRLSTPLSESALDILSTFVLFAVAVLTLNYALQLQNWLPLEEILRWLWVTPLALICVHLAFRKLAPTLLNLMGGKHRAVIVGITEQGLTLAQRLPESPYHNVDLLGYFDDRSPERLPPMPDNWRHLGHLSDLAPFCKAQQVHFIYIALPMTHRPRVLHLLDELRDTTASIYFVPDSFMTGLIQGRIGQVCDVPVIAACETPFSGINGLIKRGFDLFFSLLLLILLSPVFIAVALAVKLTSPGPVLFRQRRHGLNGEEIVVYKFRSMTVCEDGAQIRQAQKNDSRLTSIGGFLRKTSLDELPQLLNVVQGRMSLVGPRPHALAHNAFYREQIKGYMVRHKVRPGLTGWAQVNGCRGETETVEKMRARIEYDLDYLRHWSLGLDLKILLMTAAVLFRDRNAY